MIEKNLVDVIDNTVNQISNGIQTLGLAIQKIAPDVWKILLHRQKVLAINDVINGCLILFLCCILCFIYKKIIYNTLAKEIEKDSDYIFGQIACGVVFLIIMGVLPQVSIKYISNGFVRYNSAEYEAVKDLLTTIKQ